MSIKLLMVDVDGVIVVHPDPDGWSVNLSRDLGLSRDTLRTAFFDPHFQEIVEGRARLRDRLEPVLQQIAPHLTCEQLIRYWLSNDSHLNQDLLEQLERARLRGLKLHLATVQEHERADYLWRTLDLQKRFDAMHYAADIGYAKPSTQFFVEAQRRSGFHSNEIFFIDDKVENVQAARCVGWHAAVWTDERSLDDLLIEV